MRESFLLYTDIGEVIESMDDKSAAALFRAIVEYEKTDVIPEIEDPIAKIAFIPVRQKLDVNNKKWAEEKEKRRKAAETANEAKRRKSEETKTERNRTEPNGTETEPNGENRNAMHADNVLVPVPVLVPEHEPVPEKRERKRAQTRFSPPTIAEVQDYCRERGNNIDASRFVDFYASKGWKVGSSPMKDWKAAVRTWEQRNDQTARSGTTNQLDAWASA